MTAEQVRELYPDRRETRKILDAKGINIRAKIAFIRATYGIQKGSQLIYEHVDTYLKEDGKLRVQIRMRPPQLCEIDTITPMLYDNVLNLISSMSDLQSEKGVTLDSYGIIFTFEI